MNLDLTLDGMKVPAIDGYTPPFGTKITRTDINRGGLSTREVTENVLMPFARMRPTVVTENSSTGDIEYDAKIIFSPDLESGATLTLGEGAYPGCELTLRNMSSYACTAERSAWSATVPAGSSVKLEWNGTSWDTVTDGTISSGSVKPATSGAVYSAVKPLRPRTGYFGGTNATSKGWYKFGSVTMTGTYKTLTMGFDVNGIAASKGELGWYKTGHFHLYARVGSSVTTYDQAGLYWDWRGKGILADDIALVVTNDGTSNRFDLYGRTNATYTRYSVSFDRESPQPDYTMKLYNKLNDETEFPSSYTDLRYGKDQYPGGVVAGTACLIKDIGGWDTMTGLKQLGQAFGSSRCVTVTVENAQSATAYANGFIPVNKSGVLRLTTGYSDDEGRSMAEFFTDDGKMYWAYTSNWITTGYTWRKVSLSSV